MLSRIPVDPAVPEVSWIGLSLGCSKSRQASQEGISLTERGEYSEWSSESPNSCTDNSKARTRHASDDFMCMGH